MQFISYLCIKILSNMTKKKVLPLLQEVTIEKVAAEGKCLFHYNEKVVFVPFCVPGDVADVQITRKKHSFCEGRIIRFIHYSTIREKPFCKHFGICGGCKWQNLPYTEQLKVKQQQVFDQLSKIGKIKLPEFRTILGSEKIKEYRNKLEFGCADRRWYTKEELEQLPKEDDNDGNSPLAIKRSKNQDNCIGFHITGAFDKIYPIERCWLMDNQHNMIRNEIRDYAFASGMTFFDVRTQHGLLRNIMFRNSNTGEWMVLIQFHYDQPDDESKAKALLQHIADQFPQITSLLYVNNQKCNDTIGDLDIQVFKGKDHIFEKMEGLKFKVGPKSFYQTNTEQAYHLYSVAREFAGLTGKETVYDLYTGTGTIANFIAGKARQVIGIEYVPEAIEDAKVNSHLNAITNTTFFAGDMKDILTDQFVQEQGHPDVIITDPPRAGMHSDVIKVILNAKPERIVYVSCNPATQARDLSVLDPAYEVMQVQPVDMFPHTPHVENVVLLQKRKD